MIDIPMTEPRVLKRFFNLFGQQPCAVCGESVNTDEPVEHWLIVYQGTKAVAKGEVDISWKELVVYPLEDTCLRANPSLKPYVLSQVDIDEVYTIAWRRMVIDPSYIFTPDSLDEALEDPIVMSYGLEGRLSETWFTEAGVGQPIVKIGEGHYIKINLSCMCGAKETVAYLGSGLHHGAFCYAHDEEGHYLANLRDQSYYCKGCLPKKC